MRPMRGRFRYTVEYFCIQYLAQSGKYAIVCLLVPSEPRALASRKPPQGPTRDARKWAPPSKRAGPTTRAPRRPRVDPRDDGHARHPVSASRAAADHRTSGESGQMRSDLPSLAAIARGGRRSLPSETRRVQLGGPLRLPPRVKPTRAASFPLFRRMSAQRSLAARTPWK